MKNFRFFLFCLSFLAFCSVLGFNLLLFSFPYGLFRPMIACEVKDLDLGTIGSDTDIDCQFEIENIGNRTLDFKEVVPACGSGNEIKVLDFSLQPLPPGAKRELSIRFHPFSLRSKVLKKLVVSSSDPKHPRFILSVSANVEYVPPPQQPPLTLAPIIR